MLPIQRYSAPFLHAVVALLLTALLLPAAFIVYRALAGVGGRSFLSAEGLLYSVSQTVGYVIGVALLALLLALPAAWMTVAYTFRARRLAAWLLFLPFALPPYITAYVWSDIFRLINVPADGLPVACFATALAVYPYVYFFARAAFRQQHCHIQSSARVLGCSRWAAFWRVSFPLARPAIVVGVALVVMESLNDIAVAEYFGVQTLGISVYDLWLNRSDPVGATRLAFFMMVIVLLLVWAEDTSHRKQAQYVVACDRCYECERAVHITGGKALVLWVLLLLPPLAGFVLPVLRLLFLSVQADASLWWQSIRGGFVGSIGLSSALAMLLLVIGALVVLDKRYNKNSRLLRLAERLLRVLYALPGTVLAQGAFLLAAALAAIGGGGVVFIGGWALLLLASCSRFFIIAGGALDAGMNSISPQVDSAARLAAAKPWRVFFRVHLPLIKSSVILALVMVFLEGIKELPMTLLLRPFNFDTLATVVYQYASDEGLAEAAPSALLLVCLSSIAVSALFWFEGRDTRGNG